jgi:hypothetical protein
MATDRDDVMLEHLKAIREDLRVIKARQLEHTLWLAKLESGQGLVLGMVTRLDDDIERVKRGLDLLPAAEGV